MRYSAQYVADTLRLLGDHFQARGYSDTWLFSLAEDAVANWRWQLARRAIDLFWGIHKHELEGWEKGAINYIDYLFTLESIIWTDELRAGLSGDEETLDEVLEELPL